MSSNGFDGSAHRNQETSAQQRAVSIDHLPQLLHGRTVLLAGFALKTHGSFVKGLMPLRAGRAGFFFSFRFNAPASLKEPFFFNWSAATVTIPSTMAFTLHVFRLQSSGFGDGTESLRCSHDTAGGLHRLHRFHRLHGGHYDLRMRANVLRGLC